MGTAVDAGRRRIGGGAYAAGHPRQGRDKVNSKQIKAEGCIVKNRFFTGKIVR